MSTLAVSGFCANVRIDQAKLHQGVPCADAMATTFILRGARLQSSLPSSDSQRLDPRLDSQSTKAGSAPRQQSFAVTLLRPNYC